MPSVVAVIVMDTEEVGERVRVSEAEAQGEGVPDKAPEPEA